MISKEISQKLNQLAVIYLAIMILMPPVNAIIPKETTSSSINLTPVSKGNFGKISPYERDTNKILRAEKESLLAGESGCCANPLVSNSLYCGELIDKEACCPNNVSYNSTKDFVPHNQLDCESNYWDSTDCSSSSYLSSTLTSGKCYQGCCYDESIGQQNQRCLGKQERGDCLIRNSHNIWIIGEEGSDQPCIDNETGNYLLSNCSGTAVNPCLGKNEADCKGSGVCFWCGSNAGSCTLTCEGYCQGRENANVNTRECVPPDTCNNDLDDDFDGKRDDEDFCCYSDSSISRNESNTCSCPSSYQIKNTTQECFQANGRILSSSEYRRASLPTTSFGCCNATVKEISLCPHNQRINELLSIDQQFVQGFCSCYQGGQPVYINYQNQSDPNYDKFCCNGNLQASSCVTSSIFGYVKDTVSLLRVSGATINISLGANSQRATSDDRGYYQFQNLAAGTYAVKITHQNYLNYSSTLVVNEASREVNFSLQQKPSGNCVDLWPAPNLIARVERCNPSIILEWSYECVNEALPVENAFTLQVSEDGQSWVSNGSYSRDTFSTEFPAEPDKRYYFRLVINPKMLRVTNTLSNVTDKSSGNKSCFEYACNGFTRFCLNPTKSPEHGSCNPENMIDQQSIRSCSGGNCFIDLKSKTYSCPNYNAGCKDLGLSDDPPNLFGMYYYDYKNDCLDFEGNNCYYDYSETSIDKCTNCFRDMTCYDYRSSFACADPQKGDNCLVSINASSPCQWYENISNYKEYGKGICYDPKYEGTNQCWRCGKNAGLFANTNCSAKVCDLLGACFANATSCAKCSRYPQATIENATSCYDFADEESCTGNHPYYIPAIALPSPYMFNGSYAYNSGEFYISPCSPEPQYFEKFGVWNGLQNGYIHVLKFKDEGEASFFYACQDIPETKTKIGDYVLLTNRNDLFNFISANSQKIIQYGIRINNFSSAESINFSQGACSVNNCEWDGSRCYKDANDEPSNSYLFDDDCNELYGSDPTRKNLCERDAEHPITFIKNVSSIITVNDGWLTVNSTDFGWGSSGSVERNLTLYYCVGDQEFDCIPYIKKEMTQASQRFRLTTLDIPFLNKKDGIFNLRYYATDGFGNIEPIKEFANLRVDTKPPIIRVSPNVVRPSPCRLEVNVSLDERANCSIKINGMQQNAEISDSNLFNFTGLGDGYYILNVTCKDAYNNTGSFVDQDYHYDCIQKIENVTPKLKVFKNIPSLAVPVKLYVIGESPPNPYKCYLDNQILYEDEVNLNFYIYSFTIAPGFYQVNQDQFKNISCYNSQGDLVDSEFISFYVDSKAPRTSIMFETSESVFDEYKGNVSQDLKINFSCRGDSYFNISGDFAEPNDCKKIYHCNSTRGPCSPNLIFDGSPMLFTAPTTIYYFAEDKAGNNESINPTFLNIDNTRPAVSILEPLNNFILNYSDSILPKGKMSNEGGNSPIISLNVTWSVQVPVFQKNWNDRYSQIGSENWSLIQAIVPYPGNNTITAIARDSLGRVGVHSINVFADANPPEVLSYIINGSDKDDQPIRLEFSTPFWINATIRDTQFTALNSSLQNNSAFITIEPVSLDNEGLSFEEINDSCSSLNFVFNKSVPYNTTNFSLRVLPPQVESCFVLGNFTVNLHAKDRYGWESITGLNVSVVDSKAPVVQVINIVDYFGEHRNYKYNETTKKYTLGTGIFNITFNASEPLILQEIYFTLKEFGLHKTNIDLSTCSYSAPNYTCELRIDRANFLRYDGKPADFFVKATDRNGFSTASPSIYSFFIDAKGPNSPLTTEPRNGTIFQNIQGSALTLYGHEYSRTPSFKIVVEPSVTDPAQLRQYTAYSSQSALKEGDYPSVFGADPALFYNENHSILLIKLDQEGTYSVFPYSINVNKFINCKESPQNDHFYKIVDIATINQELNIHLLYLDRSILANSCADFYVYDNELNNGSFKVENISISRRGTYIFNVWAEDDLGNVGAKAKHYLTFDNVAPEFIPGSETPPNGTLFCETLPEISIRVSGTYSAIAEKFIDLIEKTTTYNYTYACTPTIFPSTNDTFKVGCNVSVPGGLPNGDYLVNISVKDAAGNANYTSWEFSINQNAPCLDALVPRNGEYINDTTPMVMMKFRDFDPLRQDTLLKSVVINKTRMINITEALKTSSASDLIHENYTYTLSPETNPNEMLNSGDGEYQWPIHAERIFYSDEIPVSGPPFFYRSRFILDTSPPRFTSIAYPQNIRDAFVVVIAHLNEPFKECRYTESANGTNMSFYSMESSKKGRTGINDLEVVFNLPLEGEGTKDFYLSCTDQAGNENNKPNQRVTVTFDNQGPSIIFDELPEATNNRKLNISGMLQNANKEIGSWILVNVENKPYFFIFNTSIPPNNPSIDISQSGFLQGTSPLATLTVTIGKNISIFNKYNGQVTLIDERTGILHALNRGNSLIVGTSEVETFSLTGFVAGKPDPYTLLINVTNQFVIDADLSNQGQNEIISIAYDRLGNFREYPVKTVVYDTTKPSFISSSPEPNGRTGEINKSIEFTVGDNYKVTNEAVIQLKAGTNVTQIAEVTSTCPVPEQTCTFIVKPAQDLINGTTYTLTATIKDLAGNQQNISFSFIVDTDMPTMTLTVDPSFIQPFTNSSRPTLVLNFNHLIETASLNYSFQENFVLENPVPQSKQFMLRAIDGFADGNYSFTLIASRPNSVGRRLNITTYFVVDTTPPELVREDLEQSYHENDLFIISRLFLEFNATLNELNVYSVEFRNKNMIPYGSVFTQTIEDLALGINQVILKAKDKAGNENNKTIMIDLDNVPPFVEITAPQQMTATNNPSIRISGNYSDRNMQSLRLTGAVENEVNIPVVQSSDITSFVNQEAHLTTASPEIKRIRAVATDRAALTNSSSVDILFDNIGPALKRTEPAQNAILGNLFSYLYVFDLPQYKAPLDFSSVIVSIDPNVTFTWANNGMDSLTISAPNGLAASQAEDIMNYTIYLTIDDILGNTKTFNRTFIINKNAPLFSWMYPPTSLLYTNKMRQSINLSIVAQPGSTVNQILLNDVSIFNGQQPFFNFSYPVNLTVQGENHQRVRIIDNRSNFAEDTRIFFYDTVPPVITIDMSHYGNNLGMLYVNQSSIEVRGSLLDIAPVKQVKIFLNGVFATNALLTSQTSFIGDVMLQEGTTNVTVEAVDEAGNARNVSFLMVYDTRGPIINFVSPLYNLTNVKLQTINATLFSNYSFSQIRFIHDGLTRRESSIPFMLGANVTTVSKQVTLDEGNNTIMIIATNGLLVTSGKSILIRLDITKPKADIKVE